MRNLTTSLELSQELKKENVPQESMFYWIYIAKGTITNGGGFEWQLSYNAKEYHTKETIKKGFSAFLAEEIGRWLPKKIKLGGKTYQLFISTGLDKQFFVVYANELDYHDNAPFPIKMRHNISEAMGDSLLYFLRQGIISSKDLV